MIKETPRKKDGRNYIEENIIIAKTIILPILLTSRMRNHSNIKNSVL